MWKEPDCEARLFHVAIGTVPSVDASVHGRNRPY